MSVANEQTLRLPIIYILTVLGICVGFLMTYLYDPLNDRLTIVEDKLHEADKEIVEIKSDIKHLKVEP